jgi:hypothetical protein
MPPCKQVEAETKQQHNAPMNARLDPLVSEFETEEQAANYDRWFRAKVQAAIDDPRPSIPHDQVMAKVDALIARHVAARQER